MSYKFEIDHLQLRKRMVISNIIELQKKALALQSEAIEQYEKEEAAANIAAADYEHMDNAIDDGVFNDLQEIEELKWDCERIANDLKKLLDYVQP